MPTMICVGIGCDVYCEELCFVDDHQVKDVAEEDEAKQKK